MGWAMMVITTHTFIHLSDEPHISNPQSKRTNPPTYLRLVVALRRALGLLLEPLPLHVGRVELRVGVADLALRHKQLEPARCCFMGCGFRELGHDSSNLRGVWGVSIGVGWCRECCFFEGG